MNQQINPRIKKIQQFIMKTSFCLEIVCALILIIAIFVALLKVPQEMYSLHLDNGFELDDFIAKSFEIVIGVELLKMFCRHDLDSIVEVLLFAIARQIVIEHLPMQESILGIISVAILFAVRKYLFIQKLDDPCEAKRRQIWDASIRKRIDEGIRDYLKKQDAGPAETPAEHAAATALPPTDHAAAMTRNQMEHAAVTAQDSDISR